MAKRVENHTMRKTRKVKDDRKHPYTYCESDSGNETTLEINLDYHYTYDDIKLIWEAQENRLVHWLREQNIPEENIRPIVCPDDEIHYEATRGEVGSLSHYLKEEQSKAALEKKENKSRLIFIPLNTGGHWVTLILYFHGDNTLASAGLIQPSFDEVPDNFYLGIENNQSRIVDEIKMAYPEFEGSLHCFAHYIQSNGVASDVLSIENGIAFIKWVYTRAQDWVFELKPTLCNEKQIKIFWGEQLLSITNETVRQKFYNIGLTH